MKTKLELIKNYPIEALKNWGDYFGYPEAVCKNMVDMADVTDWQNVKIAVLDDFGFQMINYLMNSKKVPLQNIYFLVSEEDEVKVELMRKWYSNFLENTILQTYNIDMSFDLIIANPPYGKSSSLSRKIVNKMIESKVAKEMIVLAPFNTYTNAYENISDFKFLGATNQYFTDASLHGLSLTKLLNKKTEKFKSWEDLLCSTVSKDLVQLKDAVVQYNKTHKAFYKTLHNWIGRNAESIKKVCNERNSFLITLWQPQNKVHVDEAAMDIQHNLKDNPIIWGKDDGGLIEFETRKEFENFRDWFYKKPGHSKEAQNTFIYKALAFLDQAYNGGTTVLKYNLVLPNLDWSHPWTDREILKEIGLPEDFLEKEKEETTACKNY